MDRQYHGQNKKEQKDRSRKSMDRQYNDKKNKEQRTEAVIQDLRLLSFCSFFFGHGIVCPLNYGFCPFVLFSFCHCIVCPLIYGFCPFVLFSFCQCQKKKEQKDRSRKSMDRQYNDKKKKEQKDRSRKSMDRQYHGQNKKEQKASVLLFFFLFVIVLSVH
jgi:phosphate/sulfate permease